MKCPRCSGVLLSDDDGVEERWCFTERCSVVVFGYGEVSYETYEGVEAYHIDGWLFVGRKEKRREGDWITLPDLEP